MVGLVFNAVGVVGMFLVGFLGIARSDRKRWVFAVLFIAATLSIAGMVIQYRSSAVRERETRDLITGGTTYASVVPQGHDPNLSLAIWNEGDNPLTGVAVEIIDFNTPAPTNEPEIIVGTIPARGFRQLTPSFTPRLKADGIADYMLLISAMNGRVEESLEFRRGKNLLPWAFRYHVQRTREIAPDTFQGEILKSRAWSDDLGSGLPAAQATK